MEPARTVGRRSVRGVMRRDSVRKSGAVHRKYQTPCSFMPIKTGSNCGSCTRAVPPAYDTAEICEIPIRIPKPIEPISLSQFGLPIHHFKSVGKISNLKLVGKQISCVKSPQSSLQRIVRRDSTSGIQDLSDLFKVLLRFVQFILFRAAVSSDKKLLSRLLNVFTFRWNWTSSL